MKNIEKEIHWHILDEEHENGYITFSSKAYGKATIILPEGFAVPSKYKNCFDNKFDFLTDEKLSDEQILLKYLESVWNKIIESNYSDDAVSLFNTVWKNEALKDTLDVLNEDAKNKNVGTIKDLIVEQYNNKDHEEEVVKASDRTYKLTRTILTEYVLVNETESQPKLQTKPTEKEIQWDLFGIYGGNADLTAKGTAIVVIPEDLIIPEKFVEEETYYLQEHNELHKLQDREYMLKVFLENSWNTILDRCFQEYWNIVTPENKENVIDILNSHAKTFKETFGEIGKIKDMTIEIDSEAFIKPARKNPNEDEQ